MYYKHTGLDDNKKVRKTFLMDGKFRFTQPKHLDDPKEAKPKIYIDTYSPKDLSIARKKLEEKFGGDFSDDDAITFDLKSPSKRYGELSPDLLENEGFSSMAEYDEQLLLDIYQKFKVRVNSEIGVFSLTSKPNNIPLWSKYSNDFNGLVIGFSEKITNNQKYISNKVHYDPELVSFEVSLNSGVVRFNGHKVTNPIISDFQITNNLINSFLFHKTDSWKPQDEFRLITKFPKSVELEDHVHLETIPFNFFKELYIGYNVSEIERQEIISIIKNNPELSHICCFNQIINPLSGDLEFVKINL
jgi:hypothetical protein